MPLKKPEFIVAELSKTWEFGRGGKEGLSSSFEDCIAHNLDRGYELENWKLTQTFVEGIAPSSVYGAPPVRVPQLIETIIAVFRLSVGCGSEFEITKGVRGEMRTKMEASGRVTGELVPEKFRCRWCGGDVYGVAKCKASTTGHGRCEPDMGATSPKGVCSPTAREGKSTLLEEARLELVNDSVACPACSIMVGVRPGDTLRVDVAPEHRPHAGSARVGIVCPKCQLRSTVFMPVKWERDEARERIAELEEEKGKAIHSARQFCGEHIGVSFDECPRCWGQRQGEKARAYQVRDEKAQKRIAELEGFCERLNARLVASVERQNPSDLNE